MKTDMKTCPFHNTRDIPSLSVSNDETMSLSTDNTADEDISSSTSTYTSTYTSTSTSTSTSAHMNITPQDDTNGNQHQHDSSRNCNSLNSSISSSSSISTNVSQSKRASERKRRAFERTITHSTDNHNHNHNHPNKRANRSNHLSQISNAQNTIAPSDTAAQSASVQVPLTFLCLSKSWVAATNRAISHPQEAQYGCTSSARSLLPLGNDSSNNSNNNNNINNANTINNTNTSTHMASSPLALVTRYGAPSYCIKAVLNAEKRMVRRCIPNRGNPLHEAVMLYPTNSSDSTDEYVSIVRMLLKADEALEEGTCSRDGDSRRATLMQDVDGNVPLHLLIRQAFYHYLGGMTSQDQQQANNEQKEHPILAISRELIESSPDAVSIPDCTEFEETPLILALKSSVYANEQHAQQQELSDRMDGFDYYNSTLERKIFDICKIMLQSSPAAASRVMVQNGYTAVHSAVFHGRCCDIIRLLLNADEVNRKMNHDSKNSNKTIVLPATMQANKFGELPLHFATMRGECTRSIALLSQAAPWAVLRRDVKLGLTPIHWLWVRFMDTMVERFGKRSFNEDDSSDEEEDDDDVEEEEEGSINGSAETENDDDAFVLSLANSSMSTFSTSASASASALSSVNTPGHYHDHIHFDLEYNIRTEAIDPPVHYTRMRHIVAEHSDLEEILTNRVVRVLRRVRERHKRLMEKMLNERNGENNNDEKENIICQNESVCPKEFKTSQSQQQQNVSKHECPFSKSISPSSSTVSKDIVKSDAKCPYTHLAQDPKSQSKCPFTGARNTEITNTSTMTTVKSSITDKRCPFRCPFVFDSYPLNEDLLRSAEEEEALREEHVISLFWAKVTSLLHAAALANILDIRNATSTLHLTEEIDYGKIYMLHTACSSPCPFSVVRLCLELYPEQLMERDSSGKLPLHHAALRFMDPREFSSPESEYVDASGLSNTTFRRRSIEDHVGGEYMNDDSNTTSRMSSRLSRNNIIEGETSKVFELLISSSPNKAAGMFDSNDRLPLHCFIDTAVKSAVQYQNNEGTPLNDIITEKTKMYRTNEAFHSVYGPLKSIIQMYPDALEIVDGETNLYPFMQASAVAKESLSSNGMQKGSDNITLSLVYSLLLEKPSIISALLK